MQRSAPYAGRHRGRHRAPVERNTRGLKLPSAAAAALTLTATGAAVLPGLTAGTAVADTQPPPPPPPTPRLQGSTPGDDTQHIQSARAGVRHRELAEQAAVKRAEARARVSRAAARQKLLDKKEAELADARAWVMPVKSYRFSSPYGWRWGRLHAGDDFATPVGTPAVSMSAGTVVFAGQQSGYGSKIEIRYWDGTLSYYAHLSRIDVNVGDEVTPDQVVGATGNTGHSTGPHLHLEIHPDGGGPVDPRPWLAERGLQI